MLLDSSNKPGISVLMCVYIREKPEYFSAALQSLVNQTRAAEQIVLVCDGPLTRDLDAVIERFRGVLPLSVIRLPKNLGLSHALNEGLSTCDYEWIARFDSDDLCEPFRFARQLNFIDQNPDVDVVGGNILEFSMNHLAPDAARIVRESHADIVNAARFKNPMNHVTVLMRRSAIFAVLGYPHDIQNEDYALWVKLMSKGYKLANMPDFMVRVRGGADMVSRRGGLAYLNAEYKLQSSFRRQGFIGPGVFIFNVAARVAIRLCPHFVRLFLYKSCLRVRPRTGSVA